jgi:hypothetical protein
MPDEAPALLPSLLGVTLIAAVHVGVHRLHSLHRPESAWLDVLAGAALGYVFVDILPHLATKQQKLLAIVEGGLLGWLSHHAYLLALAGFLVYLAIVLSGERARAAHAESTTRVRLAARLGALSLTLYVFLIGYMVAERSTHGGGSGLVFAVAMAAHFVGLDHHYRALYPRLYDAGLRFAFATAVYLGWAVGSFSELSEPIYALLFAFLAGGMIVLLFAHELPRVRTWRPYAGLCAGATAFTALLMLAETFAG